VDKNPISAASSYSCIGFAGLVRESRPPCARTAAPIPSFRHHTHAVSPAMVPIIHGITAPAIRPPSPSMPPGIMPPIFRDRRPIQINHPFTPKSSSCPSRLGDAGLGLDISKVLTWMAWVGGGRSQGARKSGYGLLLDQEVLWTEAR